MKPHGMNAGNSGGLIRSYVERVERLNEEVKALRTDIKEIYAEAKANGFDTRALRQLISQRSKDPKALEEQRAVLELYANAIGHDLI